MKAKRKPKPSPAPSKRKKKKRKSPRRQRKRKRDAANSDPPVYRKKKKRKPGPPSYSEGKTLFRRAGYASQLHFAIEQTLSEETHQKRRQGFKLMWDFAPEKCEQLGFGKPGSFGKLNGHEGKMWGWPKECTMTNMKAGKILLHLLNLKQLTMSQLEVVRKSLAYAYQLTGNTVTKWNKNWPEVYKVWKGVTEKKCTPTRSTKPKLIPTPDVLKDVFTRPWDPQKSKLSLLDWIISKRAAYDTLLCGHRPNKDMEKMKNSRTHKFNSREGWCWTDFVNGRSKLRGAKKNSRPWKQWSICWCKGGKHVSPTLKAKWNIDETGNPMNGDPGFDTRCITAGFEFTNLWLDKKDWRRYPNLVGTGRGKSKKGTIGRADVGEPKLLARRFMTDMGVGPFDHNSGRKGLGRMLAKLNIAYEPGFEVHGDQYGTWESRYQNGCRREQKDFTRRTQSDEFDIATKALRLISQWMGLGSRQPTMQLCLLERQNDLMLRAFGLDKQADELLLGLNAQVPEGLKVPTPPATVKPESVERVKPESVKLEKD